MNIQMNELCDWHPRQPNIFYNKMIILKIIAFRFSKKPFMLWKWLVFVHFITMKWIPWNGDGLMSNVVHFFYWLNISFHIFWSIMNFYIVGHFFPHIWFFFVFWFLSKWSCELCVGEIQCNNCPFLHVSYKIFLNHRFFATLAYDVFI
jgi:hypothetical protein